MTLNFSTREERNLFIKSVLSFFIIQLIGLFLGWWLVLKEKVGKYYQVAHFDWCYFLFTFISFTLVLWLLSKLFKRNGFFKFIFALLIVWGAHFVFSYFLTMPLSLALAIVFMIIYFFYPRLIIHNLVISFLVWAAGILLGLSMQLFDILIVLLVLVIYDFIAVRKSQYMVGLFKNLSQRGLFLALVIPRKSDFYFHHLVSLKRNVSLGEKGKKDFVFLGSGDLVFPLIFSVAALKFNLACSLFSFLGGVGGFALASYLLLKEKRPLPGLPFLVLGNLIGFLFAFYIFYL